MNTLIYVGFVIAGAVTLLIEAYRNYNSSLTSVPFKEHPILQNVEVAKLCTPREKNIGFVFYSLLYLVTYILVLSSTEIYELVTQAAASSSEIGPTDDQIGSSDEPQSLFSEQYGKPIFISAAIIAIFSIGALKPVESTMRSLAHRLAGVPRGVYRVIEILHGITFEEESFKNVTDATPLCELFTLNAQRTFQESYDKSSIPTILLSLKTIDYLAPTLIGTQRNSYFSLTQLDKMAELSKKLEADVDDLKGLLVVPLEASDDKRKELFDKANQVANDTIALFAVHFLRNNRAVKNLNQSENSAIAKISNEVKRAYRVELNAFALGTLSSLVLSVSVAFAMVYTWHYFEDPIKAKMVTNSVTTVAKNELTEINDKNRDLYAEACAEVFNDEDKLKDVLPDNNKWDNEKLNTSAQLPTEAKEKCIKIWKDARDTKKTENIQGVLFYSFKEVASVLLATVLAAITAIFGREVRKEDESWPAWKFRRPPFLRLSSMALIPAIMAVVGVAVGSFLVDWYNLDFVMTENQIQSFFRDNAVFFAMHLGFGFIMGVSVLILIDQHDEWSAFLTIPLGIVCAFVVIFWYYLTVITGYAPGNIRPKPLDFETLAFNIGFGPFDVGFWGHLSSFGFVTREAIVYGAYPAFFLITFAIFLEILEEVPISKRRSGQNEVAQAGFFRKLLEKVPFLRAKATKKGGS
ncbi:hypothetical protein ROA7450_00529 [Roseovarius albus]|uniref:Uncharacterized protein n=1 Tax=Roseovarius albus TaxID=1247867 RepID=A0A1X6YEF4_9RHOB|nr:hypothetical protein [Roseovarius albus]SLN17190.1 hypothetical protein ROA7450_00529 [Roseovarius albus]